MMALRRTNRLAQRWANMKAQRLANIYAKHHMFLNKEIYS